MALRYAVLGALAEQPASGYQIVKRFDRSLNHVWWASQAAVYTELKRLEADGLVAPHSSGARNRQTYAITRAGRRSLEEWLRTPHVRQPRDELVLRVFSLWLLPRAEAAAYLDTLAVEYESQLAAYEERRAARPQGPADDRQLFNRVALDAGIAHETAMAQWARDAARDLRAGDESAARAQVDPATAGRTS